MLPQEVAKSSAGQHGSTRRAATAAVSVLPVRNTRERVLRNYQFLNPIYRKKVVKMWMLISGRIAQLVLEKKICQFLPIFGYFLRKKKPNKPWLCIMTIQSDS